jgi:hypothetical protein
MTYARGNVFGLTASSLDELKQVLRTRDMLLWTAKAPYGSMLSCVSDNFFNEFKQHLKGGTDTTRLLV